ncbi:peptidoglycan DD-metalloendopeptidase family protein [Chitiniphilus eburneus]|uniref:LysM peptidoglycan-binding domain-containing protein n=1 Tax=Chitiniphilus eburneus TaxID=2571148 RepID=A0A4U0Q1K5_9NEIS|nr:peptidoglycan DD-metalloendopeptidase family protein [Chitiniphilus eburneus]TJZ73882.1 LysM peptidoglycan-binding domain-containing protein [Chitiniphilus eburneus]
MTVRRSLLCLTTAALLAACGSTPDAPPAGNGFYRVKSGDTLYRIARNHGRTVAELTRWNKLSDPTAITAGQLLRVSPPGTSGTTRPTSPTPSRPDPTPRPTPSPAPKAPAIRLAPPAQGKVIGRFDGNRNKGINYSGSRGSPVLAAAAGKVVYVGEGIRSYGRLIIVKHSEDYLTAYAHNETLLAREGDQVKQGQRIATMGDSGADQVMLHFELRYKGNAINPAPFLP